MTLATPGIDYKTLRDDILTLLRANVATLNLNLTGGTFTSTTEQIIGGDPIINPQVVALYPTVSVKLVSKDEDFSHVGNHGRKRPVVNFAIYGVTAKIENDMDAEIAILANNIEAVFRNNIQFGTICIYSNLRNGEFGAGNTGDVYVNVYRVQLSCEIELK